jgi:hypothetical protein
MRQISPNIFTLLNLDNPATFYLVKIVTPLQIIQDTTASFDIASPSLGLFVSQNNLMSVDTPRLSNVTDRATYKVVYIDPLFEKRAMFENVLTGSSVTIWIGFYNTSSGTLGSALPGDPLIDANDLTIIYSGVVDTQGYVVDPQNGTVTAVVECSSPMASLGMVRPMYTSKDSLLQRAKGDTAFDQVYAGSGQISYLWGKA